jgi:hypothetical protein
MESEAQTVPVRIYQAKNQIMFGGSYLHAKGS